VPPAPWLSTAQQGLRADSLRHNRHPPLNLAGKKVRGPAPLSLALAHTSVSDSDVVQLSPWTETDFRDGEAPWWA